MKNKRIQCWLLLLMMVMLFGGCGFFTQDQEAVDPNKAEENNEGPVEQDKVELVLYFADDMGEYLHPEVREVVLNGSTPAEMIVRELIDGPKKDSLFSPIPKTTELLGLKISDRTAEVNFSRDIQTDHAGGTASEVFTIYSIVNSLTEMEEIDRVWILVEGEAVESLAGHVIIREPLEKKERLTAPR